MYRINDLGRGNEDLVEFFFDLMTEMMIEIFFSPEMDAAIQKVKNGADARIDKYNETIEVNDSADVHVDKYYETIEVNNGADVRLDK